MTYTAATLAMLTTVAQIPIEDPWTKGLLQVGIAGAWLWWLTRHLKEQNNRDDLRHAQNIKVAQDHARAMERLTLTCYDVLDQLSLEYPHAKVKVREIIRRDAQEAINHNGDDTPNI